MKQNKNSNINKISSNNSIKTNKTSSSNLKNTQLKNKTQKNLNNSKSLQTSNSNSTIQEKKQKTLNPTSIKKVFSKVYLNNPNYNFPPNEQIMALSNRYGFCGILDKGFFSNGENTLEISLPEDFDISLKQQNGFSLFFWFLITKQTNNLTRYLFKKGNGIDQWTPTIGLLNNNTNLFIKILTSNQKTETLITNKKLENNIIYSFTLSLNFDVNENITEINIYIDGTLDSQITVPGVPFHNNSNIYLGKPDNSSHGFMGVISEIMLLPRALQDQEIIDINNQCIEFLSETEGETFNTAIVFESIFQRSYLMEKYIKYTNSNPNIVDNLNLNNDELKEIVCKYDEEERKNNQSSEMELPDPKHIEIINNIELMLENPEYLSIIKQIYINSKFINTILFLANGGEDNIEMKRIINIFTILSQNLLFNFDIDFLTMLAKNLQCLNPDNKKELIISEFFNNLKEIHDAYFPEEKINNENDDEQDKNIDPIKQHENLLMSTAGFKSLISEDETLNMNFKGNLKIKNLYPNAVKKSITSSKNRDIINADIHEYNKDDIVNHEDIIEEESKTYDLNSNNNFNYSDKIKVNEEEVFMTGSLLNQESKTTNSKVRPTSAATHNNNLMFMDSKKNNTNNLDKIEIYSNEQDKIIEANKEDKSNIEEEEENNKHEYDPSYPPNWADGAFEVVINHCYNCHEHTMTTRHMEFEFIDKFNEIALAIMSYFPKSIVIGNYDDLEYFGSFDIYLHGLGPFFDDKGRYFLFKKQKKGRFPKIQEIIDKLIALSIVYGSSINLEAAQNQFFKDNKNILTMSKHNHSYPAELSEKANQIKEDYFNNKSKTEQAVDMQFTKFYCLNWGCGQTFVQANNHNQACVYHPGVWQFASYNGYWPECWSCCEGAWDSEGCTIGYHKGVILEERVLLCLQYGEINPLTNRPDSACGKYYNKNNDDGCVYHTGYLKKGVFTCCGGSIQDKGCFNGKHQTVEYPDIKAKLYFYPKPVKNPGIINKISNLTKNTNNKQKDDVGKLICKCDFFKKIDVIYPNLKTKFELLKVKYEKEINEPRYCMNYTCESIFYEKMYEKGEILNCCCHPGKWDHGCTGTKLVDYYNELYNGSGDKPKIILWKPHWTCCHGEWNSPGCKMTRHHGPLLSTLGANYKRYPWPSERLKLTFTKVITNLWRNTLKQYNYDRKKVEKICKKFWKLSGNEINIKKLPELCDELKLYLLVVNDKADFSMKFNDIVYQKGTIIYFIENENVVNMNKFIEWWFMDYNKLLDITDSEDKPIDMKELIEKFKPLNSY